MKPIGWAVGTGFLAVAVAASFTVAGAWPFTDENDNPTLAPLLEQVTPAVVNVAVAAAAPQVPQNPLLEDPFFRRFFDLPEEFQQPPVPQQGVGSGVIIDAERGLIVSNNHVVQNADSIVVTLTDQRQFEAEVIGSDPPTDVALLKIEADGLSELQLGNSDDLDVGDFVVAIGNPFGLGQTATAGIVSALGRSGINVEGYEDFIQTDASINPGNSGGALVGLDGTLKGINSAILSPAGGNIGIGFAIPSNMVREVVDQLLEYGEVQRGRVGIGIQDVVPGLSEALGLGVDRGALVSEVEPGSPAEEAGIEVGDVIIAVNGEEVANASQLRNAIGLVRLGETVTLTYVRDGQTMEVDVRVGPAEETAAAPQPGGEEQPEGARGLDGAELVTLDPSDPRFDGQSGVLVASVRPNSAAARNGLRPNDIITAVNRTEVTTVAELTAALEQATGPVALRIERMGRQLFVLIQ
ncbi:MAG TPA: Do family serine endopeptidase [Gammaproteobacteria bacterium]